MGRILNLFSVLYIIATTIMSGERKREEKTQILETLYIPVPNDTKCVACPDIIPKGEEALQSPSTPGTFYHFDCFRKLVREAGKDPDRFIKIVTPDIVGRD
jgi:hypothetical protein